MAIEPKPFQKAAINAAVQALTGRFQRFLVADEVGLGKTIVASGVIQRLSREWRAPLTVFYVCSNSLLANQNLARLAAFLPQGERQAALSQVDRPSLMPASKNPPNHPSVRLYSLSPGTAMARGGGRSDERAFAAALLRRILGGKLPGLEPGLRLSVDGERFKQQVRRFRDQLENGEIGDSGLADRFRRSLRELLGLSDGQHLPPRLREAVEAKDFRSLASILRAALALAALGAMKPDLVIFDEFQRFRELLEPDSEEADSDNDAASRVLQAIRGRAAAKPAILLLSATPYVPYRGREEGSNASAASDFYQLLEFLAAEEGKETRRKVEEGFTSLAEELRKGMPDPTRIGALRTGLESMLCPLMCRTERSRTGQESAAAVVQRAQLLSQDVRNFRGFADALRERYPEWAVPLWSSIPLPMQSLGQRYKAWRGADWSKANGAIVLSETQRNKLEPLRTMPHPRLRALLDAMSRQKISLPWVAPSRPWWNLEGPWAAVGSDGVDGKLLVFSRYRATPASVAGLVSYALEVTRHERRMGASGSWEAMSKRSLLAADPDRPGLLGLFHPSPLLAGIEPLRRHGITVDDARRSMYRQLSARLKDLGVAVVARGPRDKHLAPWQMIAALEERARLWNESFAAWQSVIESVKAERNDPAAGSRLEGMIGRWNDARTEDVSVLDDEEVRRLADFALEAPGVVLGRALGRHWPEATRSSLATTTELCWRSLRAYLDNPLFAEGLGSGRDDSYPDALRRAVREGNLESVLDEHFWYVSQADSRSWEERLETFGSALRLRDGSSSLHESADKSFRLRTHAAVAMTEARSMREDTSNEAPVRPDEVRQAFNTPFWPHVLVTTSVGQEGLDFHPWCRAIAHWDPPAGPVSLEQREGRITRHAGLNVRRVLGKWAANREMEFGESPWTIIARRAEAELSDETGLRPWWTADGTSNVQRLVLTAFGSEIEGTMSRLARERALYRLVLGMPDQADLLELLMSRESTSIDLKAVCVDLMAMKARSQA